MTDPASQDGRPADSAPPHDFDVVVMGGAIAGASTALLLRRWHPGYRVLVVEKSEAFDWKVGESTVEVSGYFLSRVLRLYDHLSREQLAKQGFRYWFHNASVTRIQEASEVGGTQLSRTPSFQLDRAKLDEHVLHTARREGATVWRPARIHDVTLQGHEGGTLTVEHEGQRREVRARWIVDATGRQALLARKRGGVEPIATHPTASIWVRYRGVKDLDGPEMGNHPDDPYVRAPLCSRRLGTNHFTGWGYWIWFIPLSGGETSVGLVWDKRLVDPGGASALEKLQRFLDGNPLTRQLLEGATPVEEDCRFYGNLPYFVDKYVGPGWSAVGDAAGFLDPFYSPGLDQMAFSVFATLRFIDMALGGRPKPELEAAYEDHNLRYGRFFRYFYESIYRDKYYVMGDYDTMTSAFLMDTALYYRVAVIPAYRGSRSLLEPPYYGDGAFIGLYPIRFYNQRLVRIARRKMELGIYGNHNAGRRPGLVGFSVRSASLVMLAHGLARYLKAEAAHAWSYVVRPRAARSAPVPMPVSPTSPASA
ncbi:MAG: NAD(P)/FAD-dependent oxidoreductase [Acidobacteriota bacterium]